MKVQVIGGGPGGLYFALLAKKQFPAAEICVSERNARGTTFGWGVVFSDETLSHFANADLPSYEAITANFIRWDAIEIFYNQTCERSEGHGFCGISRKKLIELLTERCESLGVTVDFDCAVQEIEQLRKDVDLVVAADGVRSAIRETYAETFQPDILDGKARYIWLGTPLKLDAFTFFIENTPHGVFQAHAYPFQDGCSTFIIECTEDTWLAAGLDRGETQDQLDYLQEVFATALAGSPLWSHGSSWIHFKRVKNQRWFHENVALLGDAAHTAHFSIGSGTKLAMEDAIALVQALDENQGAAMSQTLERYEELRQVDVAKLQKAAKTSQEWFENLPRYVGMPPLDFAVQLLTRSQRVTYENLSRRDPSWVERATIEFARSSGVDVEQVKQVPPPMFTPFRLREMELDNRVVISPMCQYSAKDGIVDQWHLVHLGSRAIGGAGLIIAEMTAISPDARITPGCTGIYNDQHVEAWANIVAFTAANSRAKIGLQLGHAGRKAATQVPWQGGASLPPAASWPIVAPSALAYKEGFVVPAELTRAQMSAIRENYVAATKRANAAGFDMIELHLAHGYLLASFISPLTNLRTDDYGGAIANRMKFPLEVFRAIRDVWPQEKPISVRISATDWAPGGLDDAERLELANALKNAGCDIIDVSSGQTVVQQEPEYGRMYQTRFADEIRQEVGIATMAVGAILNWDHINSILLSRRADLCALARPHLYDPYFTRHAAAEQGYHGDSWPVQYESVDPGKR